LADSVRARPADRRFGWLISTPALIAGIVVSVYPLLYLLASSLTRSTLGRPFQEFVGGANFADVLGDDVFRGSVVRTVLLAVVGASLQLAVGLAVALLLRQLTRGQALVRTLVLLPMLTPPVMAAVVWKLMLDPNGGLFNAVLRSRGLIEEPLSLLGSTIGSIVVIALADTWQWTPLVALLIFAGLLALPDEVYEAARIDGVSGWQSFRYVTLPLVQPVMLGVFLIKIIMSFKIFDLVYVLTAGGPGDSTTLTGFLVFRTALREFDIGRASAQTLLFVVVVTVVTIPVTLLAKRARW